MVYYYLVHNFRAIMCRSIKYFVVSLPRTGTLSICKMAQICGLRPKHVPHTLLNKYLESDLYDFFADTPVFCPSVIENICINEFFDSRFIYIEKNYDQIFSSWNKIGLYKNYLNFVKQNDTKNFDYQSYKNAFQDNILTDTNYIKIFNNHKQAILNILNSHNKKYLFYNFNQSWSTFCSFINKPIPKENIPILNQNTMFDKI